MNDIATDVRKGVTKIERPLLEGGEREGTRFV